MICNFYKEIINTYYTDYKFFFNKPNVEGLGFGYKYKKNICTYEPVIQVFVSKKLPIHLLDNNKLIPKFYKKIKTDVIETGFLSASDYPSYFQRCNQSIINCSQIPTAPPPYFKKVRPVECGYCVSLLDVHIPRTGTLGYIVTDNEQLSETYCFISNNVTFTDYNTAPIGSEIVQPSVDLGGRDRNNIIAKLLKYIPINFSRTVPNSLEDFNTVDTAVASFVNFGQVNLINPIIPEIGVPAGIIKPQPQQPIQWTGCLSGNQKGSIISVSVLIKASYEFHGFAYFKDVILSDSPEFTAEDRGALVCDLNQYAIGLLFASSVEKLYRVVCGIDAIQSELKVTLLTV